MDKLTICNSALRRCGAEPILVGELTTPTTKRGTSVVGQYEITQRELLADSPWNFAIKRVAITVEVTAPLFGFEYKYALPADCIRVLELENKLEYRVEGSYILTNEATSINIKYIYFNDTPSTYTGAFVKALTLKLAEDISYELVQSAALQKQITEEAERYLRKARSMNSQEGTPEPRYPVEETYGVRQ